MRPTVRADLELAHRLTVPRDEAVFVARADLDKRHRPSLLGAIRELRFLRRATHGEREVRHRAERRQFGAGGGVRGWWRCPACDRRCGVLLAATPESAIVCRRCLGAQYAGDYPGRHRDRQLVALLRSMASGYLDEVSERELDVLSAKRRRGVRRGRRVMRRAVRLLVKLGARVTDVCDPFSANKEGTPAVGR